MIPRPVVTLVVLVLLAILAADVGAQIYVPGHTASPLIDGGIITLIGAIIGGSKGPKPEEPPLSTAPLPVPPATVEHSSPTSGRHHHRSEAQP